MTTETTPEAAYTAACLPDRLRCYAATLVLSGHHEQGEFTTLVREAANKLEAADALLSLSARYREAHALHATSMTAALQGQCRPLVSAATWRHLEDERKAAGEDMEAAKSALLSAALDIT